jgi:23S rRNA pseudouridine1911/1915/1917 synthase
MKRLFEIISEDEEFLVINKPAGLVCHPTKGDVYSSLISRVRLRLGSADTAHMVNRLDRETSGVVIVAKNVASAAALRKLWEERRVEKEYRAFVHGRVPDRMIRIDAPLGKDPDSVVAIKDCVLPGGTEAETVVTLEKSFERNGKAFSVVRVVPRTGRKHQIRIHLSHIGHPIVGDKLYGGDEGLYLALVKGTLNKAQAAQLILKHHALHAARVTFEWLGVRRSFYCPPEPVFESFENV